MTISLENYAMKILADAGCDCYTYGDEQSKHILDDLKEKYPNGMEHGYAYIDVANAILAISRPKPIVKPEWKVVWDSNDCCDSFGAESFEQAKYAGEELLASWMEEERATWKSDKPNGWERERWNNMIYTCGYYICQYNKMRDEYEIVYEPTDYDVMKIGWYLLEDEDEQEH